MKDYNHSSSTQPKAPHKKRRWMVYTSCVIFIILGVLILLHRHHDHSIKLPAPHPPPPRVIPHSIKSPNANSTASGASHKPQFDFYHLLGEIQVKTTQPATLPSNNTGDKQYIYSVQAASTRNYSAALTLQNQLKSLNIDTHIVTRISAGDRTWYKIIAGPFNDIVLAQSLQDKLRLKQINALLIKEAAPVDAAQKPGQQNQINSTKSKIIDK